MVQNMVQNMAQIKSTLFSIVQSMAHNMIKNMVANGSPDCFVGQRNSSGVKHCLYAPRDILVVTGD